MIEGLQGRGGGGHDLDLRGGYPLKRMIITLPLQVVYPVSKEGDYTVNITWNGQ